MTYKKTNLQFAICNFHTSLFYFSMVYNKQSINVIFHPITFNGNRRQIPPLISRHLRFPRPYKRQWLSSRPLPT